MAKSGIRYNYGGPAEFKQWVKMAQYETIEGFRSRIAEAAADGARHMQHVVNTAENYVKEPGRIDSTDMRRAIEHMNEVRGNTIIARFGWINPPPYYTIFQEKGTEGGQNNGQGIKEMAALAEGFKVARSHFEGGM